MSEIENAYIDRLRKCSRLVARGMIIVGSLAIPSVADAQSLRCPTVTSAGDPLITTLWKDIGGAETSGSAGPLGCPIGANLTLAKPGEYVGEFLGQEFQRGWILLGRGINLGKDVIAVRGIGQWFVWWRGLPPDVFIADDPPTYPGSTPMAPAATWVHGGVYRTAPATTNVRLRSCTKPTKTIPIAICHWESPLIFARGREMDLAGRLGVAGMTTPDQNAFPTRINAAFPGWAPCFVAAPSVGEGGVAYAMVAMRGTLPCAVTGHVPRGAVLHWLRHLSFPEDAVPGTDIDGQCEREGDLDVTIAGVLHLVLDWRSNLDDTTYSNVLGVLEPWGGKVRQGPMIEPDEADDPDVFDCLGFAVIETENHMLLQEVDRYLINDLLHEHDANPDFVNATNGVSDWLRTMLLLIARRDFYEYNSLPYARYQLKAIRLLYDHAKPGPVRTAAEGALHWLFAKQAIASSLDRDIRPFRRQPEPHRYGAIPWYGDGATSPTVQAGLLVGPPQHVTAVRNMDLTTDSGRAAFANVDSFPALGSLSDYHLADVTDIANTKYRVPPALRSWLESRYTDTLMDRVTFLQIIHHREPGPPDGVHFTQANAGVELYSGNRNWIMAAGGNAVPPSIPNVEGWSLLAVVAGAAAGAGTGFKFGGPAGLVIGAVIGAILGGIFADEFAEDKQDTELWKQQVGVMRPTSLIPTALGLDRAQTLRFGATVVLRDEQSAPARLCVAEGFMCGFDLAMPSRPFPDHACPMDDPLPAPLDSIKTAHRAHLGCQTRPPFELDDRWRLWTYDRGQLVINFEEPAGSRRWAAAWVVDSANGNRTLDMTWMLPANSHDWFNVYAYRFPVSPRNDDAPETGYAIHRLSGDPDTYPTSPSGYVSFPLGHVDAPIAEPRLWLLLEGCDPTFFLLVRTGHDCWADRLPTLDINVAPTPKQPFSCRAEKSRNGIVMEVGSCTGSPYGMYVYIWNRTCRPRDLCPAIVHWDDCDEDDPCPSEARDYGYVLAAPSRGWMFEQFQEAAERTVGQLVLHGPTEALPTTPQTISVPRPPVVLNAPIPTYDVSFRWRLPDDHSAAITGATGAPSGFFAAIGPDPSNWAVALGTTTAPTGNTARGVIRSSGNGCFVVYGPTVSADPTALVVDLRQGSTSITQPSIAEADAACQ